MRDPATSAVAWGTAAHTGPTRSSLHGQPPIFKADPPGAGAGLGLRATTFTTRIAALFRGAGTDGDKFLDRANILTLKVPASGVQAADEGVS
ncbi:hypothetical protein [Kitasatospora sp. NPDC091276]|uniref:hypothetical protein n=1 Tax=Kitasatospora sp. NPDC091276 TaxID=3155300 RepID=UPI00342E741C